MRPLVATIALTALLSSSVTAFAQEAPSQVRLRVGAMAGVALADVSGPSASVRVGVPSLTFDVGAQINSAWAVFGRASAGTIVFSTALSLQALGEYSLARGLVSIGGGVGLMHLRDSHLCFETNENGRTFALCPDGSWSGLTIPAFVAFNLGPRRDVGRRQRVRIEAGAALIPDVGDGNVGGAISLGIGYVAM